MVLTFPPFPVPGDKLFKMRLFIVLMKLCISLCYFIEVDMKISWTNIRLVFFIEHLIHKFFSCGLKLLHKCRILILNIIRISIISLVFGMETRVRVGCVAIHDEVCRSGPRQTRPQQQALHQRRGK